MKINPNDLKSIWIVKKLISKFDLALKSITNEKLKNLSFSETQSIQSPKLEFKYCTYRKYVDCKNGIQYNIGFQFDKEGVIVVYADFFFQNKIIMEKKAKDISKILITYKYEFFDDICKVRKEKNLNDFIKDDIISVNDLATWLELAFNEVVKNEMKIDQIIH